MSTVLRLASATADDALDAIVALLADGSALLYDGTPPATPATAVTTQTLLATVTLETPAGTVASGSLTFTATDPAIAVASGTATWSRMKTSGAATVLDVDVSATAGGGGLELDDVDLIDDGAVSITGGTFSFAAS